MLDTKHGGRQICCSVSSRFLISEAHNCSTKVPTNLISATRECYCNQQSAPASLLPSTVLVSQKPGKLLSFSVRSGWVSYSHQRRWQGLERCKWPQQCVQSLLTHVSWNSMCACGHIRKKLGHFRDWPVKRTKKELFYQSRYSAGFFSTNRLEGCYVYCCSPCIHIQVNKLPSLCSTDRGAYLIQAHYTASLIFPRSLASLDTISSA